MAKLAKDEKEVKQYMELLKQPGTDFSKLHKRFEEITKFSNKVKILDIANETSNGFAIGATKQVMIKYILDSLNKLSVSLDDMFKYEIKESKDKHVKKLIDKAVKDTKDAYESVNSDIRRIFDNFETFVNYILLNFEEFITFNTAIKELLNNNFITHEEYNTLKLFNKIRNIIAHNENIKHSAIFSFYEEISLFKAVVISTTNIFNKLFKNLEPRIKLINYIFYTKYDIKDHINCYMYIKAFLENEALEEYYNVSSMKIIDNYNIIDSVDRTTIYDELKTFTKLIQITKLYLEEDVRKIPSVLRDIVTHKPDLNLYDDFEMLYAVTLSTYGVTAIATGQEIKSMPIKRDLLKNIKNQK